MGCSVGFKYAKNALTAGALPRTPLGNLRRSPDILVGWGGGHQSQCPTDGQTSCSCHKRDMLCYIAACRANKAIVDIGVKFMDNP